VSAPRARLFDAGFDRPSDENLRQVQLHAQEWGKVQGRQLLVFWPSGGCDALTPGLALKQLQSGDCVLGGVWDHGEVAWLFCDLEEAAQFAAFSSHSDKEGC
jgi:hypothetical protein